MHSLHIEEFPAISPLNANTGHTIGYGNDVFTERALGIFKDLFGPASETFFVFTGTAANVLRKNIVLIRSF